MIMIAAENNTNNLTKKKEENRNMLVTSMSQKENEEKEQENDKDKRIDKEQKTQEGQRIDKNRKINENQKDIKEECNEVTVILDSFSKNESFARMAAAAFAAQLNPTLEEISDIKTAVSEAITNSIIHGYAGKKGKITMNLKIIGRELNIMIEDFGVGISDILKAMEPLYTTRPELERSGMGFAFMEAFMDELKVESRVGQGTKVTMKKLFQA